MKITIPTEPRTVVSRHGTLFWPQYTELKSDGTPDQRVAPRRANGIEIFVTASGKVRVYRYGVLEFDSTQK